MDAYPSVGSFVAGRYRIDAVLGEGGMGAVFRAADAQGNNFALKFPSPEIRSRPGMMSRFANEAVAASRIASEHAVQIFGVEATETGVPFIVMELLQGTDLDQIIEGQAPVDTPRAIHFALQALRGLQVAHAAGVVHRDMKPANCFIVNHNGEADFVKLIDFGITKLLGDDNANQTRTSVTMGTPAYMSPEQAKSAKAAEPRSDLYSVGVILYELLTKKRPYEGESQNELVVKICTEPPLPIRQARPDLPKDLASAVEHALVKIPAGRYDSAQAFARALAPFADARSAAVLQRIEAGVVNSPLGAGIAPTDLVTPPPPPAGGGGNRTAIMEPGAFVPDVAQAFAATPGAGQRTMVADGPIAFNEPPPVAAATPPMSPPPVVMPPPIQYEDQGGGGGGNGALFAVVGVLILALVGGGLYFGGVFGSGGGGSSSTPAAKPAAGGDEEEDESTGGKKKKKKTGDGDEPAAPDPTVAAPDPAVPTTVSPSKTVVTPPKPTTDAAVPVPVPTTTPTPTTSTTTTAPTIVLPPGWPIPTSSTTAPPPATTAPPPATTVPPINFPKKPKIGGS